MQALPVFSPTSPQAVDIENLFIFLIIVCLAILALMTGLVVYACFRYRSKPGEGDPKQHFGKPKIEVAWTVAPLVLLIVIFVFTARAVSHSDPAAPDSPPDLVIVGHQWWWEADYPKGGFRTANEIHVAAGRNVSLLIKTDDVIHDFWAPQLARKIDAIPAFPHRLVLHVDRPGTYLGACSEFCGAEHAWMRFRVIVTTASEFDAWQQQQVRLAAQPQDALAIEGSRMFRDQTCMKCHTIAGTEAKGRVGPDLTHFTSRKKFAGDMLDNTSENVARWLKNPQAVKPDCHMPNMQFTDSQVKPLVAYLEELK